MIYSFKGGRLVVTECTNVKEISIKIRHLMMYLCESS